MPLRKTTSFLGPLGFQSTATAVVLRGDFDPNVKMLQAQLHVSGLDFIGLDAQVIQGLPLCRVVEHDHEFRDGRIQLDSLVVSECLPQGMTAVVTGKVDGLAPGLYQPVHGLNGEGSSLALEQLVIIIQTLDRVQPML